MVNMRPHSPRLSHMNRVNYNGCYKVSESGRRMLLNMNPHIIIYNKVSVLSKTIQTTFVLILLMIAMLLSADTHTQARFFAQDLGRENQSNRL